MLGTALEPEPGFEEADRIQRFWNENYAGFRERFPDHFVAVSRQSNQVVASNRDLALLVCELRERGLDVRTDVAIEFIPAGARNLFL